MRREKSMEKIKLRTFLIFITIPMMITGQKLKWNCANDFKGFPLNVEKASGLWYEAVRVPPSAVPACVEVTAPKSVENGNYTLQLDYITNTNNQWKPTTENLTFVWNNNTENGIFVIKYGSDSISMTFTFKIIFTDYTHMAAICYYTNYAPAFPMMKIMTRSQHVNRTLVDEIQKLGDTYGFGDKITWVEQSGRCNGAKGLIVNGSLLLWILGSLRHFFLA